MDRLKRMLKNKWFWIVLVIVLVIVLWVKGSGNKSTITYLTETVKRANLVQTVSATGEVESATETNLSFKVSSRIVKIPVIVGQKVKMGVVLVQLDAGRSASQVNQYQASLMSAQANLEKLKAGASAEELTVSQRAVDQAQSALDNTLRIKDQGINNLKESLLQKMQNAVADMATANRKVRDLVLDSSYTQALGNLNVQLAYDARSQLYLSESAWQEADQVYRLVNSQSLQADLTLAAIKIIEKLSVVKDLTDKTYQLLLNTSATSLVPQATIDAQKTIIAGEQTSIYTDLTSLQTAKDSLGNQTLSYEQSVTAAGEALKVAQAQLQLKQAGPRDFDVKYYQAAVASAQASLQAALTDLSDYSLRAPQDGVITKVNNKIGEQATPGQTVVSMIAESNLQIKMDVPESDIAKIQVGNAASITLDAFGSDKVFDGHVTFVDPASTPKQDVVYYKVTIAFDNNDPLVKSGMTANVTVHTANKENILIIPSRAVNENSAGKKMVKVKEGEQVKDVEVTLGLKGDEGLVEITGGLNEGQTVVTFIKDTSKSN